MANNILQLVTRLVSVTGMSEDTSVNVINIGFDSGYPLANADTELQAMRDFFTTLATGQTETVSSYIGDSVSRAAGACSILAYQTDDPTGATPFGSPFDSLSITLGASGVGAPMPEEVASVISYHGDLTDVPVSMTNPFPPPATIRPAARRRGRMFVGPLLDRAGVVSNNQLRPSTTFRTDLGLAFKDLAETINAITDRELGVWSKADGDLYPAVGGYVDDAWDTQRRRGLAPGVRTPFTIV